MSLPTAAPDRARPAWRSTSWRRSLPRPRHPAQFVVAGFAGAVLVGTVLLLLPVSRSAEAGASVVDALFVATSAVCVTGLSTVDTAGIAPETLLATDVLMLIGGGSAGTAGGIKVTTFAVLLCIIHRPGPQLPADTTNARWGPPLATRGDFPWPPAGTFTWPRTLRNMGVNNVWAKAISEAHGRILEQLGIEHVVYPEHEMGRRVAHLVKGRMLDFIQFEPDHAMVKTAPPTALLGVPLSQSGVRRKHGITVVGVKQPSSAWTHATGDTVLSPGDLVIVSGEPQAVETFSDLR